MNQKELTKTLMMVSNLKKPLGLYGSYKKICQSFKDVCSALHRTSLQYSVIWA